MDQTLIPFSFECLPPKDESLVFDLLWILSLSVSLFHDRGSGSHPPFTTTTIKSVFSRSSNTLILHTSLSPSPLAPLISTHSLLSPSLVLTLLTLFLSLQTGHVETAPLSKDPP